MLTIVLPADLNNDLSWEKEKILAATTSEPILWHIDFQFDKLSLSDTQKFLTYALALEHFNETIWKAFKEKTHGVCLYKGTSDFVKKFVWNEDDHEHFREWIADIGKSHRLTPFDFHLFCAN